MLVQHGRTGLSHIQQPPSNKTKAYFAFNSPLLPLTLYLIETPFNAFANRADPDQAALVRAA